MKIKVGPRLTISRLTREDVDVYHDMVETNYAYLSQWLQFITAPTYEESQRMVNHLVQENAQQKSLHFLIYYQGQAVGMISYNMINKLDGVAEIGYWLIEEAQGQGIVTQCLKFLIDYAFNQLIMAKVLIFIAADNLKSRELPEKLGFRKEGILRQQQVLNDKRHDLIIYGLLVKEWEELNYG